MTKSLQELIDSSIFISTEYQARVAELVGTAQWDVDFTAQSLSFETTPPVSLSPYLLGTESESRGTWVWSWQQLGYFPDTVVSAAIQAREAGAQNSLEELSTDEVPLSEGLARRLTLASKAVTGLYAHYPLPAGAGVRAWTLLDGEDLVLPEPTVQRVGRVIAQTLQGEKIEHHALAVDSYAQQRGFHIEWDTEATAVLTLTDGALRLWFDEGKISGIESAVPQVGADTLAQHAQQAAAYRAQLAAERTDFEKLAAAEAQQQQADREREAEQQRAAEQAKSQQQTEEQRLAAEHEAQQAQEQNTQEQEAKELRAPEQREQAKREAAPAAATAEAPEPAVVKAEETPQAAPGELDDTSQAAREEIAGVATTANLYPHTEAPFDQDPQEDSEHGTVTTSTLPGDYAPSEHDEAPAARYEHEHTGDGANDDDAYEAETVELGADTLYGDEAAHEHGGHEPAMQDPAGEPAPIRASAAAPDLLAEPAEPTGEQNPQGEKSEEEETKKKGFFSRFFGL